MRRAEPIRFGTAVSQNCSGSDSVIPTLPRLITTIVHSTQTLLLKGSATTERNRFLRAIRRPFCSQNSSFSGVQSSIQVLMPANVGPAAQALYRHPVEDFRAIWLRAVETEPGGSRTD